MSSFFQRLGGETALRSIIDDFVDRVASDVMIGFLFRNVDLRRLKELEYQHAAEHLGGPVSYRGRPLQEAHAKHRILGGQFGRRREILRQTLQAHGVPEDVVEAWIEHQERLRPLITADPVGQCND